MKQVLLYLPVVHAGHEAFFARHQDADEILLLGNGFKAVYKPLAKDIRALSPWRAAEFIRLLLPHAQIRVIEPADLPAAVTAATLVLPDEDITRNLAAEHHLGNGRELTFDKTFLRWDRAWSQARRPAGADADANLADLPANVIAKASELADHSSDWWRQVGAIAWRAPAPGGPEPGSSAPRGPEPGNAGTRSPGARSAEILGAAWNHHHPTEYAPYTDGDPRDNFSRGVRADLSTAIHAEASVIARAARSGTALTGADLYVTTFPCPACARLIAESGFRRCYFSGPYSVLDGDTILRAAGIQLFWLSPEDPPATSTR